MNTLYFLTATWLASQAGNPGPMPSAAAPIVIEAAPSYGDGQGQSNGWQQQQQRRGFFSRVGGWFGGLFGRSRPGGPPTDANGQIIRQPMMQQPLNTTEPPLAPSGKVSMSSPYQGRTVVAERIAMGPEAVEQAPVVQAAHDPAAAQLDLPISDKFKNRMGHEADYSWLTGQLYRMQGHNGGLWVLRFATAEEQDKHGGSVLLTTAVDMRNFREGDLVSIQGEILNGGRQSEQIACPVYRAAEVNLIERGD